MRLFFLAFSILFFVSNSFAQTVWGNPGDILVGGDWTPSGGGTSSSGLVVGDFTGQIAQFTVNTPEIFDDVRGVRSDVNQQIGSITPVSPSVSSFKKYIDNPVGYYTGVPVINIPLYTINEPGFSLPINLSYHAGGIKVNEVASNVGLGWSLNAGGVITREIKDIPDDEGGGGRLRQFFLQCFWAYY